MSPHRPSKPLNNTIRGAAFGAVLLSVEELTNLIVGQAALSVGEIGLLMAWYAAAMGLLGLLLSGLRDSTAHLMGLLALSFGFMAGGKISEEFWWSELSQWEANAIGYPLGFAIAGAGLWLVLRWTRSRPAIRAALCWGGIAFLPAFRAMNINAFGSPASVQALTADAVLVVVCAAIAGLAWRSADSIAHHPLRALLVALTAVLALTGAGRWATRTPLPTPATAANRPDVLLVIIDTLRADHLGAYGYNKDISPHLDALAARGLRYTAAGSPASWTLPAFGSFATGRYPAVHGAGANDGERSTQAGLGPSLPTLAERMQQVGYRTGAIVTNPYLKRSFGIARGFHTYSDALGLAHTPMFIQPLRMLDIPVMGGRYFYRPANIMVDEAMQWWDATQGGPRFLMLHLMDPHDPYNPPAEDVQAVGTTHEDPAEDAYDAEIRFTDRELGRLLDHVNDNTWVIVTADHGETFGEHPDPYPADHWPFTRHGHTLYQELLHVPLMVKAPGLSPGRVDRPIRAFDVVPTILQVAQAEPFTVAGQPLWETIGRTAPTSDHPVGAQAMRFGTEKRAVRLGEDKLIRSRWGDELYNLTEDPLELTNRAQADPGTVDRLVPLLPAEGTTTQDAPEIDEETKRQLEALGYVQ